MLLVFRTFHHIYLLLEALYIISQPVTDQAIKNNQYEEHKEVTRVMKCNNCTWAIFFICTNECPLNTMILKTKLSNLPNALKGSLKSYSTLFKSNLNYTLEEVKEERTPPEKHSKVYIEKEKSAPLYGRDLCIRKVFSNLIKA